jgi:hypothetical protein
MSELLGSWTFDYRPIFKKLENATFRILDLFPSSGEVKETPALLCPLERANLNHCTKISSNFECYTPSPERCRI